MESYTQKYYGIPISEFVQSFNKCPEKKFQDAIRMMQYQIVWNSSRDQNNTFLNDTKNFIEEIKYFLNEKRRTYFQNQIEYIEEFIETQYDKMREDIDRIKHDPQTKLEEVCSKFVLSPKPFEEI